MALARQKMLSRHAIVSMQFQIRFERLLAASLAILSGGIRVNSLHAFQEVACVGALYVRLARAAVVSAFSQWVGLRGRHLFSLFDSCDHDVVSLFE